jgi:hypothetical protein
MELLMIFPNEENNQLLDNVLRANGDLEVFKISFLRATNEPEVLQ